MAKPTQEFDPVLKGARYMPPEVQGMGAGRKQGPSSVLYEHKELYIEQSVEKLEGCCTACEMRNHYGIYPNMDAQMANRFMLTAHEESDACSRLFCSPFHAFRLTVGYPEATTAHIPNVALPIAFLDRPCSFCCYEATLSDHSGALLANLVEQNSSVCCINTMKIDVKSNRGEHINTVEGPSCCWLHMCKHNPWRDPFIFAMLKDNELTGGSIKVMPNSCCRCCYTNADDYLLSFPVSATANDRSILLGTTFFIDSCYFQPKFRRNNYLKNPNRPINTPHPFQPPR